MPDDSQANCEDNVGAISAPLVSIVTPVYNGAEYICECIESVLSQSYSNWAYTILDNCSTDESFAIAKKYADRDPRIRVIRNTSVLPIIQNHNEAIRHISPGAKYCKFVFADDWLYPTCVEEMVQVAGQNPSVGLVSAYTTNGQSVLWAGPSYPARCISGRSVCRDKLLGGPYLFGTMTCLLVRADLIRKRQAFFNEQNLHADEEACFDVLLESDFAFIHQVLSFSRTRERSNSSFASDLGSLSLGAFVIFLKYGPLLLRTDEYRKRLRVVRRQHYEVLARNALRLRPRKFIKYHEDKLAVFGMHINRWSLAIAIISESMRYLMSPVKSFKGAWYWWSLALHRHSKGTASA